MSNNLELLNPLDGRQLVTAWNQLTGECVKRFASRDAALSRFSRALGKTPELAERLKMLLTTTIVVAGESAMDKVIEKVAEKEAAKPKRKRESRVKVQSIKDSKQGRVLVNGRAVLPQNAKRVLAGEALSGAVLDAPKPEDALKEAEGLNLNYKRKATIKPMRRGTAREKLVQLMSLPEGKGVTVEEVMKMFDLSREQAVYRLRDLQYTGGHGVRIIKGRVYVDDREES